MDYTASGQSDPSTSRLLCNKPQLEEHDVLTSDGIFQRVYVQRSESKQAIVTYHDIGTNHISFLSFFNHPNMKALSRYFTIYHVCAPGHHEGASNVVKSLSQSNEVDQPFLPPPSNVLGDDRTNNKSFIRRFSVDSASGGTKSSTSETYAYTKYPTLDKLAELFGSIISFFNLPYFVGLGVGAGSNVLTRYALKSPNKIMGLFLINPNATTEGYYQWFRCRWYDLPYFAKGQITDNMFEYLDNHWFGYGLAENTDLVEFYHSQCRSLNPFNLTGYINAYLERGAINLARPLHRDGVVTGKGSQPEGTVVQTDVYLVTGATAIDQSRAMADMNGLMNPAKTQFVSITDCNGMVMEEEPGRLSDHLLYFLRNIGLVVALTPERLHQEALALREQSMVEGADDSDQQQAPANVLVGAEC